MSSFIIITVLAGLIATLAAVIVLSQRQFESAESSLSSGWVTGAPASGPLPMPPSAHAESGLVALMSSSIEASGKLKPGNVHDAEAVSILRSALAAAVEGEFCAEVGRVIDSTEGIRALHNIHVGTVGDEVLDSLMVGGDIDHLVVARSGVLVVVSRVRSEKVSVDDGGLFVGRGHERARDALVEEVARSVDVVAEVVGPIPVRGVVVLRDLLALPDEIRSGAVEVQGVRITTLPQLAEILTRPGPVADLDLAMARLEAVSSPSLPTREQELRLRKLDRERPSLSRQS